MMAVTMPAKSVKIPNGLGVGVGAATGVATGAFTGALEGEGDGPGEGMADVVGAGEGMADVVGAEVCACDMKIYERVGEYTSEWVSLSCIKNQHIQIEVLHSTFPTILTQVEFGCIITSANYRVHSCLACSKRKRRRPVNLLVFVTRQPDNQSKKHAPVCTDDIYDDTSVEQFVLTCPRACVANRKQLTSMKRSFILMV